MSTDFDTVHAALAKTWQPFIDQGHVPNMGELITVTLADKSTAFYLTSPFAEDGSEFDKATRTLAVFPCKGAVSYGCAYESTVACDAEGKQLAWWSADQMSWHE